MEWKSLQQSELSKETYEQWKNQGLFSKGYGIITGKIRRGKYKEKYLTCIDIDNKQGIKEFLLHFSEFKSLDKLAKKTLVVQHKDALEEKAHIYFITEISLSKRTGFISARKIIDNNNIIPLIEIKSDSSTFMIGPGCLHKNGHRYEVRGTSEIKVLDKEKSAKLENALDEIYVKFGKSNNQNGLIPIDNLFQNDFVVEEGNNRHLALLRVCESLIKRLKGLCEEKEIKELASNWNTEHCNPPLDDEEFEKQWKDAKKFLVKENNNKISNQSVTRNNKQYEIEKGEEEEGEENKGSSNIEELLESVYQRCNEIFFDQYHILHASIQVNEHFEVMSFDSKRFESIILSEYYERTKLLLPKEKLSGIISLIKSKAEINCNIAIKNLSLRVAKVLTTIAYDDNCNNNDDNDNVKNDICYYYDLANSKWQVIKITSEGWEIVTGNQNAIFTRYRNNLSQVIPNRDYPKDTTIDNFLNLFNVSDRKNKLLLLVYIVTLFIPEISKPILILRGSKGAAKTTAFELIKKVADPSDVDTLFFPKEVKDLIQIMSHNHVSYFDNISSISDDLSDILCRAVTGTGFSKRKLYSDDEDISYNFKRAIGINGINLASVRPDFLDRSLIIELERISNDKRRKDEDIKKDFKRLLPDVLGWIFDVLVKFLKYRKGNLEKVNLKELPRMAEFAENGEIISRCIGYMDNEFMDAYFKNIETQNEEVIDSSIVAEVLIGFMEDKDIWKGSATQLHSILTSFAEDKVERVTRSKEWPNAANSLSRKINELIPTIKEKGIEINHTYDNKRKSKIINLKNMEKIPSLSSYRSDLGNELDNNTNTQNTIPIKQNNNGHLEQVISNEKVDHRFDIFNNDVDSLMSSEPIIGYKHPLYYCKQHPNVQNIHFDEIKRHLELSDEHQCRQS